MTAKDLLLKLLDYEYQWGLLLKVDSRPAKIRKQQISSLQKALGLFPTETSSVEPISYLMRGEFLAGRPGERNTEIIERIVTTLRSMHPHFTYDKINQSEISWLFSDLMNFRREIYKIAYTEAVEESSPGLLYSQSLQRQLQDRIKENVTEIDETLWIILDPDKRVLDKKVLVENYGYPDEDLDEIDLEWRMNGDLTKSEESISRL